MMLKLPKYSALILAAVMLMSATVQAAGRVRPAVYMAKDFVVAVVIHPQQMASSSIVKALDIDELPDAAAEGNKEQEELLKMLKPDKVSRLILLIEPAPGTQAEFLPGVIVQYTEDIDGTALLTKGLQEASPTKAAPTPATHNGKSYLIGPELEPADKLSLCAHVADSRTLVLGFESTMKKMLSADGSDTPLLSRLRKTTLKHDFIVEVAVEPLAKALEGQPENPAADMAKMAKGISIALNLSGETLLKANVTAVDEATATQMEGMAKEGVEMGKKQFEELKPAIGLMVPPDVVKPLTSVAEQVMTGFVITRDGAELNAELPMPAALVDLATIGGKMLKDVAENGIPGLPGGGLPGGGFPEGELPEGFGDDGDSPF